MTVDPASPVLIVGGYGVVGAQAAELLRARHPDLPLAIGGRNIQRGQEVAAALGNAEAVQIDLSADEPLAGLTTAPRAIVGVANDPKDALLMAAVRTGVPIVDITRWTERLRESAVRVLAAQPTAPVLFASSWMAGVASIASAAAAREFDSIECIDISVLYALADKAGPDSFEYMDRLSVPYTAYADGAAKEFYPYTDPRDITFPGGFKGAVYRFDTPDQITLPSVTGSRTVAARIGFDSAAATSSLRFLVRSGIWRLISGPHFSGLRRSLLFNPGAGASHEIVIQVKGVQSDGTAALSRTTIADPHGQTHLTALGTVIQLERILGLDGAPPPNAGVTFPEHHPGYDHVVRALKENGVMLDSTRTPLN